MKPESAGVCDLHGPLLRGVAEIELEAIEQLRRYAASLLAFADTAEVVVRVVQVGGVPTANSLEDFERSLEATRVERATLRDVPAIMLALRARLAGRAAGT